MPPSSTAAPTYAAALSTMWAYGNHTRLDAFFEAAREMGFARIELNHQVSPQHLAGIALERYAFSSVHEPCPSELGLSELEARHWTIAALDEDNRKRGVDLIKGSLSLAQRLGAKLVVVHCGNIPLNRAKDDALRALYKAGRVRTPEFAALQAEMIAERRAVSAPYLEAVKRSVTELLEYAAPLGVRLGLENRDRWMQIPALSEMEELLCLGGAEQLGFLFDCGHATIMERLLFYPWREWLSRFSSRMIGCHLHDVNGIADHLAPGLGDVNFAEFAPFIPAQANRTLELLPSNTAGQVTVGLLKLAQNGIVCLA